MTADVLPSFTALAQSGTWGSFTSLPVPYEPSALLSAFTGLPPGEHGCFSYWHIHGETCDQTPQVVLSDEIAAPFLWQTNEAAKLQVGIVNLFGTHPPQPINGHLITYPLYPSLRACHPPRLLLELSRAGIRYGHDVSALYTGAPRDDFVALLEQIETARTQACLNLMARGGDLFVFNVTIIDRLSHFWWREVEPESGMADDDTALWRAYRLADKFIAQVVDVLRPDDHLIVFSEIGFGPLERYVSVNDILVQTGLLTMADARINPARTLAMEAVQGSHGINLNLERRYANGLIPDAEEDSRRQQVRQALLDAINPDTGLPLFENVIAGRELYAGAGAAQAPDLVVQPYDERYQPLGHPHWAKKVHRHLQTGWHRRDSFWAGLGPRFPSGATGAKGTCVDMAQTIADCLGLPPPSCYGQSLACRREGV